jgi:hypothetical protein
MKQINLSELNDRIVIALRERNLLQSITAMYSEWEIVKIKPQEFAGALEKVIRDCLTL